MEIKVGDIVNFCWYDFDKEKEYIMSGRVEDNSLYAGTQWQDFVQVSFKPIGMTKEICFPFRPERLSTTCDNLPHDDAYLVCKKVKYQQKKDDNPWLTMTEFKREHWDAEHNHIETDALEEFYRLWSIAINWRIGMMKKQPEKLSMKMEHPVTDAEAKQRIVSDERMEELKQQLKESVKPIKNYTVTQLSLF